MFIATLISIFELKIHNISEYPWFVCTVPTIFISITWHAIEKWHHVHKIILPTSYQRTCFITNAKKTGLTLFIKWGFVVCFCNALHNEDFNLTILCVCLIHERIIQQCYRENVNNIVESTRFRLRYSAKLNSDELLKWVPILL